MSGASKSGWGSAFFSGLKSLRPKQDFLLAASSGIAMRDISVVQVKCQREVLAAIYSGWVPCTPLNRGLQSLLEQPALLASSPALSCDDCSDTEPESEWEEVEASQSDSGSDDSDEDSDSLTAFDGPWMRNIPPCMDAKYCNWMVSQSHTRHY